MRREQAVNMAKQIGFSPECIDEVRLSFCKGAHCYSWLLWQCIVTNSAVAQQSCTLYLVVTRFQCLDICQFHKMEDSFKCYQFHNGVWINILVVALRISCVAAYGMNSKEGYIFGWTSSLRCIKPHLIVHVLSLYFCWLYMLELVKEHLKLFCLLSMT